MHHTNFRRAGLALVTSAGLIAALAACSRQDAQEAAGNVGGNTTEIVAPGAGVDLEPANISLGNIVGPDTGGNAVGNTQ